jgi:KUP system potassium uptake protein
MRAVSSQIQAASISLSEFCADLENNKIVRVPGTAFFLTRAQAETPPIIAWHVRANRSLHQQVVALTVRTESKPYVAHSDRITVEEIGPNFWRATAHYGFMQRPNVPGITLAVKQKDPRIDISDVIYYIGTATIVPSKNRRAALPRWEEALFAAMARNEAHIGDFMQLPGEQAVEIGRQIPV